MVAAPGCHCAEGCSLWERPGPWLLCSARAKPSGVSSLWSQPSGISSQNKPPWAGGQGGGHRRVPVLSPSPSMQPHLLSASLLPPPHPPDTAGAMQRTGANRVAELVGSGAGQRGRWQRGFLQGPAPLVASNRKRPGAGGVAGARGIGGCARHSWVPRNHQRWRRAARGHNQAQVSRSRAGVAEVQAPALAVQLPSR